MSSLALPRDPFIGRERDVARVCRLLSRPGVGLVTLTGPAGVGKTRLALELAASMREAGQSPTVRVVDLVEANDSVGVSRAIGRALGLLELSGDDIEERLIEALDLQPGVLVLDNFEHVLEAAPLVGRLAGWCKSAKIVVTSRSALRVRGEWVHEVSPLALPDQSAETPADLRQSPAVQLLVARASAAQREFRLTQDNAPAVARICAHLDGLPLAIEFAAARLVTAEPAEVLKELEYGLSTLGAGPRDLPARQRTLSDAIAWSYGLLCLKDQELLSALAVFTGSFTVDAAAAVAAIGRSEIQRGIDRLSDLGLLVRASAIGGTARWRLLETVRSFAVQQTTDADAVAVARVRYLTWLADLAEQFDRGVHSPGAVAWLDRFEAEIPELRASLSELAWPQGRSAIMRILGATSRFWFMRGRLNEAEELFGPAIRAVRQCPEPGEAPALYSYFFISVCANNVRVDDFSLLDLAVQLASASGDDVTLAKALSQRAYSTFAARQPGIGDRAASAVLDMRLAISLAERSGDAVALMSVLRYAGHLGSDFSTSAEGKQQLLGCLELAKQTGAPGFLIFAGADLGILALHDGAPQEAFEHASRAAEAAHAVGHDVGTWYAEEVLARAAFSLGDAQAALEHQASALLSFLRAGQRGPFVLRALIRAAHAACWASRSGLAARALGVASQYAATLETGWAAEGPAPEARRRNGWENDEMGQRFQLDELQREAADLDRGYALTNLHPEEKEAGRRSTPAEWSVLALKSVDTRPSLPAVVTPAKHRFSLTARETELLRLVADGRRNDEIAAELVISVKTVERHLSNLYPKLGARGRADAVARAVGAGVLFAPEASGLARIKPAGD